MHRCLSTWNLTAVRHRNQQKTAQCYQHRTVFDRYLKMIPNSQAYCIIFRNSLQAKISLAVIFILKKENDTMPRGKAIRNKNGYGTVVRLSGNRRQPYEVRVNTRMDERYYPVYDVLGRYETREEGLIALAEYNKNPYDLNKSKLTFRELYEAFYHDKYELSGKTFSKSSMNCTRTAYNHMKLLHDRIYKDIRVNDFKSVFGQTKNGKPLSHALQEHMKNLIMQMDRCCAHIHIFWLANIRTQ